MLLKAVIFGSLLLAAMPFVASAQIFIPSAQPTLSLSTPSTVQTTTPAASANAALKMFLMLGADTNWSSLPDWYSGLIRWGYGTNPNISRKPQELKAEYASVGSVPKYPYPNYPIPPSTLSNAEEGTFLHATDPAMLQVWKTPASSFMLSWKPDARDGVSQYKVYKIWFPSDFVPLLPWTEWWKNYSAWSAITTVSVTSASSYSFSDPTTEADRNGWTVMCYMIKSIVGGVERQYSFPVCGKYANISDVPPVYVSSVVPRKSWENRIDARYANVGYTFDVSIAGSDETTQNYDAKLVLYKQSGFSSTANQNSGALREESRHQLYFKTNKGGVEANLTRQRPYLLNVSGTMNVTEDPVFRIALTKNGIETMYPRDGGYYTFSPNNRVQDRLWYGSLVNPASSGWKSILAAHANTLLGNGYNAIFFDTWWPDYPEQFYNEAPSVEYNPRGAMTGEYAKALDNLARYLKSRFPSMRFLGNALGQINNFDREFTSLAPIDGGMVESCIISDGVKKTGASLIAQMTIIDRMLNANKIILCWPKFQQIRWGRSIDISPFDPATRIYGLATGLLMTQGQQGKFFYGPEELPVDWTPLGQGINYFPEYRIDIGTPSSARQSMGTYVWQRQFTNGLVVVNADPSAPYAFTVPADMRKVKITGESLTLDFSQQRVTGASYGVIDYESVMRNTRVSLPAGTALILLSHTTPSPSSSCTFNGSTIASGASVTAYRRASAAYGQACASQTRRCSNGVLSGSYQNATCSVSAAAACSFNGQSVSSGASVSAYQSSSVAYDQACASQQRTCSNGTLSGTYSHASCVVASAPPTPSASVAISSPSGGSYRPGQSISVSWNGAKQPAEWSAVFLDIVSAGTNSIVSSTLGGTAFPLSGSYTLPVSAQTFNDAPPGSYKIRATIQQNGQTHATGYSGAFTLLPPDSASISVSSPNGGTYSQGQSISIAWQGSKEPAEWAAVFLDIVDTNNTVVFSTIGGTAFPFSGSYTLPVNAQTFNGAPSGTYKIRATIQQSGQVYATGYSAPFNISGVAYNSVFSNLANVLSALRAILQKLGQ